MSYQMDFLPPLYTGDVALRFRVAVVGDLFFPHRKCVGVQAVWVVSVKGDLVTWTDGTKNRWGGEYRGTSNRRELIALSALESLATECAVNLAGCVAENAAEPVSASAA